MDLVESGAIFNFKPFNPQSSRDCGKNESLNLSSKLASRTNSRFEELFLSSPRAQELVATIDQSSYFTSSKSRIISPHKQQCFLHNSFSQTPLSSSCSGKNTSSLMDSGLINMLDFFKNGKQPRCQESALFSPVKPSNMEDDSIRTQVRDVINKLGTPLNRKGRTNDDDGLSLNPDSGYDEQQMQSCGLTTSSRSRSPTLNHPQSELPEMAIELRQEYRFDPKVSKPKPDVDGEVQEEDVDVGEFDQQNDPGTENVESKLKQTTESTVEDMEYNVVPELDVPDVPDTNLVDDKIKEPLHAESLSKVRSDKKHHLFGWYIKAIKTKNGPAIIVEGQRREDPVGELWHSTGIVTRVSPSVVETKSKSQYVLEGKMLGNETIEQGFSVQFAKAFTNGFPSNWEQLVKEHFESIVDTSSKKDKQQQEAKKSSISKKQPSLNKRTPRNDGRKPVEVELKRTSSGRLIKPPLAWWRGQRIVTDSQHNLTAIEPGGEEHTGLSVGLYDFDLKLPKTKTSLWNSAVMTPKIAKFDLTTEAKHPRKNDTTTNAAKSAKDDTWKKTLKPETSFLGESGSESTGSTSHNSRKNTEDTSEKPNTSYTDSDTSSFPKVMRPKRVLSDSSWRPSDSDSTTVRSSNTAIQKSKKSQERSKSKLTLSRKQHLEVSPEESTNNEEESQDDRDAKDHVKRNISFSDDDDDDDDDWKSPRQKIPQEKSTIDKPLREVKVVLAKNPQQRRDKNQTKDKSKDNDSATVLNNVLNDNHESDGVNSCEYFTRNKALSKNSSKAKFRKPEHYVQKQKKGHFEAQSRPESSSEEGLPRRSLRNRKEKNHDVSKNKDLRDNNKEHRRYGSRTRHGSLKHPSIVEEDEAGTSSSDEEEAQAVVEMMRSVRQRKAAAEREDSEATSDSDSSKKKMRKQTARKTKNQRSKARNTQEIKQQRNMGMEDGEEDGTDGRNWKEDEIFRLSKALHSIPLSTFGYWHSISEAVQTRTAQECRLKYDEQLNMNLKIRNPVTKPKEKQPKVNQKVVAITGGVGTMKRKRELRQLIQQNNDGYEDDIFESTPFKNTQKKFKFFTEEDAEEESDDENDDEDQHNHVDFKTPSSRTPSSRYRPLGPGGSSSNTPGSDLISPGLLQQINREDMDQYIYRLKQAKKGMGQYRKQDKVKVVKTSTPKKKATALMPKTDASIFDVQEVLEQDSDEENDYYWSDE